MKKSFQVLGALALVLWTVAGLVAWKLTSEQVHVTIAEDRETTGGPDQLALLGDQVSTLQGDLRGLTKALNQSLGQLSEELETQSKASSDRLAALDLELSGLTSSIGAVDAAGQARKTVAQGERMDRMEGLLQQILAANKDTAERERLAQQFAQEEKARNEKRAQEEAQLQAARLEQERSLAAAQAALATDQPAEKGQPQRSFLSFQLPSDDFSFDLKQHFRVITALSRVGFDAKSTLHDFSGVSGKAKGEFIVNLAHPEEGISGELRVPAASLSTALEGRDEEMRKTLDVEHHADLVFVPTSFDAASIDETGQEIGGTIHGDMTLRGNTRSIAMEVKGKIDESRRLVIDGDVALNMSDFEVEPPSKLGMIKVEDEIRVWISLRTRPSAIDPETSTKMQD